MGYELSKPQLRAELEADLKRYMSNNNNYCIVYYRLDTEAKPKINDDSMKSPYPKSAATGKDSIYYNNVLQL